jgi:hypothetical protein
MVNGSTIERVSIMGWKTVKEEYGIVHTVCVNEDGVLCIGSPYIHDIIRISSEGAVIKPYRDKHNEDLARYQSEFDADPERLRRAVKAEDLFCRSLPVYTFDGADIIEEECDAYGWPNVTHNGKLMYENTFSQDRTVVIGWAIKDAECRAKWAAENIARLDADRAKQKHYLIDAQDDLEELRAMAGIDTAEKLFL